MVPPILEIFVLWHPDDSPGERIAGQIVDHFHGSAFSGLIGGAVEVYVRSEGWRDSSDAPRPLPPMDVSPYGIADPAITAIVPVLGNGLAAAVQSGTGPWHDYLRRIVELRTATPDSVGVFPIGMSKGATNGTVLGEVFGSILTIGDAGDLGEQTAASRCRDLAQGIAQLANGQNRLTVFLSHTKRAAPGETELLEQLISRVRGVMGETRLGQYFDAADLQPGSDWIPQLEENARTSALLAIRTDLYASREWCQREIAAAKLAGMPVVILDALSDGEERGSFLMDHVARIPNFSGVDAGGTAVSAALNQLVDEALKRELWARQHDVVDAGAAWDVAWWAPHAPEPLTLAAWLSALPCGLPAGGDVRVLHPDPPLGPVEREALDQIATLSGLAGRLDIMTPRGLAARGG